MNFRSFSVVLILAVPSLIAGPSWPQVEQHAIELLQKYVRVRSINPPADTRQASALLAEEFKSAGLQAKMYTSAPDGRTNLLVRLPGKDHTRRPLLLLNHMDVVPVDASRWKKDPFGAEIENDTMWGRGTLDMKSVAVMQLTAMILLKQQGIVPTTDILFLSTCDEETDGRYGAGWMIANHWDELNPESVLDEGAFASGDFYSPGKTVFGVSVGDKQVVWLKLQALGTAGHASQPIPDNANDILFRAIEKAKQFPAATKVNPVIAQMKQSLGEFASNKFMNAAQQNTMSLTTLRSGVGDPPKVNVIPSVAEATLDCRLLPGQNAEEFVSEIKARVNDPRVTFELLSHPADPGPSATNTRLYSTIQSAISHAHPEAKVIPVIVPWGTDNQKFRLRGATGYGLVPMKIDLATLATMHSDSERIPLDQFRKALHIYFEILSGAW